MLHTAPQVDETIQSDTSQWPEGKRLLFQAVLQAHEQSALRENISREVIRLAAMGSGDYLQAIVAGLSSLGGLHAPLVQTWDLLDADDPTFEAKAMLRQDERVPGWGNGFVKGGPDEIWKDVERLVGQEDPRMIANINDVTQLLQSRGKMIYPNPSCWTAAVGHILGFGRQTTAFLFVQGRLGAWTHYLKALLE